MVVEKRLEELDGYDKRRRYDRGEGRRDWIYRWDWRRKKNLEGERRNLRLCRNMEIWGRNWERNEWRKI